MKNNSEPRFSEIYLKNFVSNNPHCQITVEEDHFLVEKPWSTDDARLKAPISQTDFIQDLNSIAFNPKFDAIIHLDKNQVEFIFTYLHVEDKEASDYIDRDFEVYFEGRTYRCFFSEPTERLYKIAKYYEKLPSEIANISAPQLIMFRDAQNLETLPTHIQKFFDNKIPRSFFVQYEEGFQLVSLESLARHLNFMLRYYDRKSPSISIKDLDSPNLGTNKQPLRMTEGHFPKLIVIQPIDEIVLRLIDVGKRTAPRFAFLYFYQVFEYAGYHYIDEKAKKALRNALKDPALVSCGEEKVSELFSIFTDLNHNDEVKMRKVIEEHCDPVTIWKEIENDFEFFCSEQNFEGGFSCPPLVSKDTTVSAWAAMWMPKTFDLLTKIRNALVHARERRESKIILPNESNDRKLKHYIPLISRIAEQVAIKT